MLADHLEAGRGRLTDRVSAVEGSSSREECAQRAVVEKLLDSLVDGLRRGEMGAPPTVGWDPSDTRQARKRLQRAVMVEVRNLGIAVTVEEMELVCEWSNAVELSQLRAENQRFSAMLDALDDSVVLTSPTGRTLYLNRRAAADAQRASGFARDEVIGRETSDIGFPPELSRRLEELTKRAGDGAVVSEDLRVPWEAGARWGEVKLTPVARPDGQIGAVALVGRDIHDRKMAEMRFGLLAKTSSLVGLEHDEMLQEIARLSIPELADWSVVDVVEGSQVRRSFLAHRDPRKAALREALVAFAPRTPEKTEWNQLVAGRAILVKEVSEGDLRNRAASEEHFRLLASVGIRSVIVVPIRSRGNLLALLSFVTTDESGRHYDLDDVALAEELARRAGQIIENARLQMELKRSEERFRVALAAGRIAVYEQDASLRYRFAYNAEMAVDAVGKRHAELFEPSDAARLDALKRRALAGERVREETELTVGDERRYYNQAIEPLRDAAGNVVGLIGAATDVTEERRAREELAQAVLFRERLIGILGHDLRNPLNAVAVGAAVLRHRPDLPEDARDQASKIDHAARRMAEMIRTLLDFAEARFRGTLPVSPVKSNIADIAREAVEELKTAWANRQIDVTVLGDPKGIWDPARMAQVISNLVANALTHGSDRTPVRLHIDGAGAEVRLTVHNCGPVIPSELMPFLFEPFRRGSAEHKVRGVGLGLYIAQQIVLAHDGTIEVTSSEDDGTRFTLRLPRAVSTDARGSRSEKLRARTTL